MYNAKYIKYKQKYLNLKKQFGGDLILSKLIINKNDLSKFNKNSKYKQKINHKNNLSFNINLETLSFNKQFMTISDKTNFNIPISLFNIIISKKYNIVDQTGGTNNSFITVKLVPKVMSHNNSSNHTKNYFLDTSNFPNSNDTWIFTEQSQEITFRLNNFYIKMIINSRSIASGSEGRIFEVGQPEFLFVLKEFDIDFNIESKQIIEECSKNDIIPTVYLFTDKCFLCDKYDYNIKEFFEKNIYNKKTENISKIEKYIDSLIDKLYCIGYYFFDIKLENIMIKVDSDNNIIDVRLIDINDRFCIKEVINYNYCVILNICKLQLFLESYTIVKDIQYCLYKDVFCKYYLQKNLQELAKQINTQNSSSNTQNENEYYPIEQYYYYIATSILQIIDNKIGLFDDAIEIYKNSNYNEMITKVINKIYP